MSETPPHTGHEPIEPDTAAVAKLLKRALESNLPPDTELVIEEIRDTARSGTADNN